jgi:hypothetical protein
LRREVSDAEDANASPQRGAHHRRHLAGDALEVADVQRRDSQHEPGDAGLHVLGEPRGDLARRSEDRRLIDVEARAVVAVAESAQRVASSAAVGT